VIQTRPLALPHGITLACRSPMAQAVAGAPRVLLLHGFPEAAFVWDEVMLMLSPRLDCMAPNLRGYIGSSAPAEVSAYRAKHLVADVVALIEAQGAPLDLLVAHDWGGAVAWNLAALRPDLLRRLLIINSPHPATFLRELRHSPAQQAASAYMTFLCRPDAEALLAANGRARLWPFLSNPNPAPAWLTDTVRSQYRAAWDNGLTGPLNYYRASPLRPPLGADDPLHSLEIPDSVTTVRVPTTVLWGDRDVALLPALLAGLERWVPDLHVEHVSDASHWIVHEQPARVAALIDSLVAC